MAFQLGGARSRGVQASAEEDAELARYAPGAGQRRTRRAAVRGELRVAVRERRRRAGGSRAASGGASSDLAALDPRFQPYLDARDGIKSQLEDLALFLRRYADGIEASPARLQQVEERLALLERLKRKYGPDAGRRASPGATRCARELADLEGGDERLAELESRAGRAAARVSGGRARRWRPRGVAPRRRSRAAWRSCAAELAMERTRFEVRFGDAARRGRLDGARDRRGRILRLAESGRGPAAAGAHRLGRRAVADHAGDQDADGRRPARVRTDAADRPPSGVAPGLIFDEVDAGIGGRVADVVGRKLRALGSAFQVLCITHLPQIAACADTHFPIEKRVERGRTRTSVTRLDADGRVEELGRMLGGRDRHRRPAGLGPRDAGEASAGGAPAAAGRRKANRSRKAKAKERKRRVGVARKYLIETFGCQMNVHDSERMAGLLEQAGFEADRRGRRRRRRRHQHLQRPRARRGEALHAARRASRSWRPNRDTTRSSRSPAAWRSRKARRSSSARPAWPTSSSARRRSAGCRCWSSRPRERRARAARSISIRTTT